MKKVLNLLLISSLLFTSCKSKEQKNLEEKNNYEQAEKALGERENKNPVMFLTVESHDKHNLIGQTVIKGTITNKAKVCTYKDIALEFSFYSKTGTLLEKDNETIYTVIAPGKDSDFKSKYYAPKRTDSVVIKIVGAKSE
jgi:hypothetical protein